MSNNEDPNDFSKKKQSKIDLFKETKKEITLKPADNQKKIPARLVQIEQLNAERPKKEFHLILTPKGSKTKEVNAEVNAAKNAEIDKKQNEFRERMKEQQGKAKKALDKANENDKGKSI